LHISLQVYQHNHTHVVYRLLLRSLFLVLFLLSFVIVYSFYFPPLFLIFVLLYRSINIIRANDFIVNPYFYIPFCFGITYSNILMINFLTLFCMSLLTLCFHALTHVFYTCYIPALLLSSQLLAEMLQYRYELRCFLIASF